MLTQDEIFDILTESLIVRVAALSEDAPLNECFFSIAGKSEAAEAIAARLERAYLILELLAESDGDAHQVDECIKAARELLEREEVAC